MTQQAHSIQTIVDRRTGRSPGVHRVRGLMVKGIWFVAALVISVQAQAGTYFFHNDHLGTPQVLTDDTQTVVWKGEYDPFGKVTETVSTVEQNLRFPGQYYDQENGLHYNYFRTYDPSSGRYLESDPIGLSAGLSTYAYVGGNPTQYYDPNGLSAFSCAVPIAGGFSVADGPLPFGEILGGAILVGAVAIDILYHNEDGSDNDKDLSDKPGKISEKTGLSVKEVKDRIHEIKKNIPKSAPIRNPDVFVDTKTGEVFPKTPDGGKGDSIGNIFD